MSIEASMYDIDLFTNDASVMAALHAKGRKVVCYMSAGTYEPFRPDAASFPESVKGAVLGDFPDEKWLDIRQLDVLRPIMEARLDMCKSKGFDGVEPDNVDGFTNRTGFPLAYADQIRYNTFLANAAHARGLSVGLKNDGDQVRDLLPMFDWALNEQCFQYNECNALTPFVSAGKAVFEVEYKLSASQFCPQANTLNFNSIRKNVSLDAYREACRAAEPSVPAVASNAVVNGGSFLSGPVAPGEIVAIFGQNLGPATSSSGRLNTAGLLDTSLAETRALFDGVPAPLFYTQAAQVNAVVPYGVAGKGSTQLEIEYRSSRSGPVTLAVVEAAPALLSADSSGKGQAAALNENASPNSARNPAARGSIVSFFATGEGQTENPGVDGKPAAVPFPKPRLPVTLRIGGVEAEILYAGSAPQLVGVLQINARVPGQLAPSTAVEVQLQVGTAASQAGVTIAIQ